MHLSNVKVVSARGEINSLHCLGRSIIGIHPIVKNGQDTEQVVGIILYIDIRLIWR